MGHFVAKAVAKQLWALVPIHSESSDLQQSVLAGATIELGWKVHSAERIQPYRAAQQQALDRDGESGHAQHAKQSLRAAGAQPRYTLGAWMANHAAL